MSRHLEEKIMPLQIVTLVEIKGGTSLSCNIILLHEKIWRHITPFSEFLYFFSFFFFLEAHVRQHNNRILYKTDLEADNSNFRGRPLLEKR